VILALDRDLARADSARREEIELLQATKSIRKDVDRVRQFQRIECAIAEDVKQPHG
jgi:hypothetical protein